MKSTVFCKRLGLMLSLIIVFLSASAWGFPGDLSAPATLITRTRATGYYPANTRLQGGYRDSKGAPLHSLEQYLRGQAPYVSVAMDSRVLPYGTKIRIQELEEAYGRPIDFRRVDTGGAFRGKGTTRMDICTQSKAAALSPLINRTLTIEAFANDADDSDPEL